MGLTAKETGGSSFSPLPQGLHQAICYAIYDLGTHYSDKFGKSAHKVLICFEIPEERIDVERDGVEVNLPRAISKQYTLSLHEKSVLRKDLQSWRNKVFTAQELEGFDLTKLLGVNCMLQVLHTVKDGKTYANIATVTPLPKGFEKKSTENQQTFFSFEDEMGIPEHAPAWVQEIIKESDEWKNGSGVSNGEQYGPSPDDDIPF